MLSIPLQLRVFLCTQATDMRKSFDGLEALVRHVLQHDPLSGDLFVFLNRRRDRVKVLSWEGDGFAIWYKRLEAGTYALPASEGDPIRLSPTQLTLLLGGIDLDDLLQAKGNRAAEQAVRVSPVFLRQVERRAPQRAAL